MMCRNLLVRCDGFFAILRCTTARDAVGLELFEHRTEFAGVARSVEATQALFDPVGDATSVFGSPGSGNAPTWRVGAEQDFADP
jgi:hypothetical protein